jgi:glycosyltransferase involved in cell wall biosynthesis
MQSNKVKLSACIICRNEESNIHRCLTSLTFCDEIVIVDSGSTDKTISICKEFTDKIFFQDWLGYGKQRQKAQSLCQGEWVLFIDADEEVSPALAKEILEKIISNEDFIAYKILRLVYFLNICWRAGNWYPEYRLRLGRNKFVRWNDASVHEKIIANGKIGRIKAPLNHYTYKNIAAQIDTINHYSTLAIDEISPKISSTKILLYMIVRPLFRFFKFYFLKGGLRYGIAGLIASLNDSFYVFLKYAKMWEKNK